MITVTSSAYTLSLRIPGPPVPKGRPRASVQGGRVHMRTPAATRAYEAMIRDAVRAELLASRLATPHLGPVHLTVHAVYAYPKTAPRGWTAARWRDAQARGQEVAKPTRPDLDNLVKAVLDGVQGGGWVKDDGQIYAVHATKTWGPSPGVWVQLSVDPPPD